MTVTPNSFVTPQTPNRGFVQLNSSMSLDAFQTLYTAGPNGSRINSIVVSSTDTVAHNITLQLYSGSTPNFQITQVVPVASGEPPDSGGPTVPLLSPALTAGLPVDQYGNQYIQLASGDTIKVANSFNAISSGQFVFVYCIAMDF